jgi:hypothetical protein
MSGTGWVKAARDDNPLVKHALSELRRAGLFDQDADYGGSLAPAVADLVRAFAGRGHTGGSAPLVLEMFEKLARHRPLSSLTSDPEEWEDRSVECGTPMWQNVRDPRAFSHDGGATWSFVDPAPGEPLYGQVPGKAEVAR